MYPPPAGRFVCARAGRACRWMALAGLLSVAIFLLIQFAGAATAAAFRTAAGKLPAVVITLFYRQEPLKVLRSAAPALGWNELEADCHPLSPVETLLHSLSDVVRVNLGSPAAVFRSQMPLLALAAPPAAAAAAGRPDGAAAPPAVLPEIFSPNPGASQVIIYHTHTGETYSLTDGVERLDGRQGGVVTVAAALQEALERKYGIKVTRSDRIHDADYGSSYLESEKTARALLAANPAARMMLDIHRDAAKSREQSVVNINGTNVAPLLFITGSSGSGPFAGLRQNFAFASQLSAKANELYPGLSLGVRVKNSHYNQHLHPHAVLVEIGTSQNSLEEAVRAAVMFADVIGNITGMR